MQRIPEPEVMDDATEARAYQEADFGRVNRAFVRRLLRHVSRATGNALDLGTGPAEIPVLFAQSSPGWKVTAIDASPAMLELGRSAVREAGLAGRIRLLQADAKDLGILRRRFDLVFSNSLLHHIHDPAPFWREIDKRTRLDGTIIVQDLRRPAAQRAARELVRLHAGDDNRLLRQLFHQSLLAAFTPAEVREQLRELGLSGSDSPRRWTVRATTDRHLVAIGAPR